MKAPATIERISVEQFHALTRPLVGLPVSRTWRGYGTAIFFELGELSVRNRTRRDGSISTTYWGQATIMLEIAWRVERPRSIFFGSTSGDRKISNSLKKLQGLKIVEVHVQGRLSELSVQLSGGFWLQSFSTAAGQPEWTLFFNENASNRKWLTSKNGTVVLTSKSSKGA